MKIDHLIPHPDAKVVLAGVLNISWSYAVVTFTSFDTDPSQRMEALPPAAGVEVRAGENCRLPAESCMARITGLWTGEYAIADQVDRLPVEVPRFENGPDSQLMPIPPADPQEARILDPFYDNGDLISKGVEHDERGNDRLVIASHDARRMREALPADFDCRIVQSPWPREAYQNIRKFWLLAERQNVLSQLGDELDENVNHRIIVGLVYVTKELAQAALAIPQGPLVLHTLMRAQHG